MNRKTISLNGQKMAFSPSPQKQKQTICNKALRSPSPETLRQEELSKGLTKAGLIPTINIRTRISNRKWMKLSSKPFIPL